MRFIPTHRCPLIAFAFVFFRVPLWPTLHELALMPHRVPRRMFDKPRISGIVHGNWTFSREIHLTNMKRTLPVLLGILLFAASAAQAQYNYTTNGGGITITGYTGPGGVVTIPGTITGLPVTSIGNNAFDEFIGNTGPTSVTVPDSVTSIGNNVFDECTSLTNVSIGNGVTNIGSGVFDSCPSLNTITVEVLNSFYSSMDGVLFDKNQIMLIRCPMHKAGAYAIPGTVTSIAASAFSVCTGLTSVTIPDGVTNIGASAFETCYSLTNVTIPNIRTGIGAAAFEACPLTSVTIPNSVTSIESFAFDDCGFLTNAIIGSNVTSIGYLAFYSCGTT